LQLKTAVNLFRKISFAKVRMQTYNKIHSQEKAFVSIKEGLYNLQKGKGGCKPLFFVDQSQVIAY